MEIAATRPVRIQEKPGFVSGLLRGLNAPAEVYLPFRYPHRKGLALEQMRSDWKRIGGDFRAVLSRVMARVPKNDPRNGESEVSQVTTSVHWQGPIPPPAALERVEQIVSGGADRILRMAEQEQIHRMECERIGLPATIRSNTRGQYLGALIAAAAIIAAAANSLLGGDWKVSLALVGVPVLGVVQALIRGRREDEAER